MSVFAVSPRTSAEAGTKPIRVYAYVTDVKRKPCSAGPAFSAKQNGEVDSLSLPVEEIFGRNHPYSAPSLCFSAAGAIAKMLFFCINAFKAAKSLD